jgi:hypothetical protein
LFISCLLLPFDPAKAGSYFDNQPLPMQHIIDRPGILQPFRLNTEKDWKRVLLF